eukprot:4729523-Prymnesium_polylepis.1
MLVGSRLTRAITLALQDKGDPDSQTGTHACGRFRRTLDTYRTRVVESPPPPQQASTAFAGRS